MKTIRTKVYRFKELSKEAQEKAIEDFRNNDTEIAWADENRQTLEEFEKIFPLKIKDWSYGCRGEGVYFTMTCSDEIEDLTGIRLAVYLWNNYHNDLYKGKYYSTNGHYDDNNKYHYRYRHSKCQLENSCVLTGYSADDSILKPVYDFMKKPDPNKNFKAVMEDCFSEWIDYCNSDIEYQNSDEYIREEIEANDYWFTQDGKIFHR